MLASPARDVWEGTTTQNLFRTINTTQRYNVTPTHIQAYRFQRIKNRNRVYRHEQAALKGIFHQDKQTLRTEMINQPKAIELMHTLVEPLAGISGSLKSGKSGRSRFPKATSVVSGGMKSSHAKSSGLMSEIRSNASGYSSQGGVKVPGGPNIVVPLLIASKTQEA